MEGQICNSSSHVFNLAVLEINVNGKSKLLFLPHPLSYGSSIFPLSSKWREVHPEGD
jgi:hypothetical protein